MDGGFGTEAEPASSSRVLSTREISRRSPAAATCTLSTVTSTAPDPSSRERLALGVEASTSLLTSVNGTSIGAHADERHCRDRSAVRVQASTGEGAGGEFRFLRHDARIYACTPSVSVTLLASMCGCASEGCGLGASPAIGWEGWRRCLAERDRTAPSSFHSRRAVCSRIGSFLTRFCKAVTCSATLRSTSGLISLAGVQLHAGKLDVGLVDSHIVPLRFGSKPPVGRDRGARCDSDVAFDVGTLVEHVVAALLHAAAEIVVDEAPVFAPLMSLN